VGKRALVCTLRQPLLSITVFSRRARNGRSTILVGYVDLLPKSWRGRRPGRADRRLRTDDDPVRTQSAISNNPNPKKTGFAFIHNRVSRYGYAFHPYRENAVGAQSAQCPHAHNVQLTGTGSTCHIDPPRAK